MCQGWGVRAARKRGPRVGAWLGRRDGGSRRGGQGRGPWKGPEGGEDGRETWLSGRGLSQHHQAPGGGGSRPAPEAQMMDFTDRRKEREGGGWNC